MKIIRNMYKAFIKDLYSNIAQILVFVILAPSICKLLAVLSGANAVGDLLLETICTIDIVGIIKDFVSIFVSCGGLSSFGDASEMYNQLFAQIDNLGIVILQTITLAICVKLFRTLGKIWKFKGLPILVSACGVLVGIIFLYFTTTTYCILACVFLFLLTCVLDMIFIEKITVNPIALLMKYGKFLLKLFFTCIATIFLTCYTVLCMLITRGDDALNMGATITLFVFMFAVIITSFAITNYILDKK